MARVVAALAEGAAEGVVRMSSRQQSLDLVRRLGPRSRRRRGRRLACPCRRVSRGSCQRQRYRGQGGQRPGRAGRPPGPRRAAPHTSPPPPPGEMRAARPRCNAIVPRLSGPLKKSVDPRRGKFVRTRSIPSQKAKHGLTPPPPYRHALGCGVRPENPFWGKMRQGGGLGDNSPPACQRYKKNGQNKGRGPKISRKTVQARAAGREGGCGGHALLRRRRLDRFVSTLQVSKLESLIADRICSLGHVTRVGYSDDGQEVTILVFHDYDSSRYGAMVDEITRRGIEVERAMSDRMISPLAIDDGPDVPADMLRGCKALYTREAAR